MSLFHRAYEVLIGTPTAPAQARYGNVGTASPLRVAFDVEKSIKGTPNKGTVKIYNMAALGRSRLVPGMALTLSVGYAGQMQTLFVGVVAKVTSSRSGAEVETALECGDGESAIMQTYFHRSYDAGVSLATLLTDIAGAMQLQTAANPTGMTQGSVVGIPPQIYDTGVVLAGPCRNLLDTYCKPQDLEWSVQNGALQIVPVGNHTGDQAEVVSRSTGLLGIPSLNGQLATFDALLNPRIAPGRLVQIQSSGVNGFFKVRAGKWTGDSHGADWKVSAEANEMQNVSQNLPSSSNLEINPDTAVA